MLSKLLFYKTNAWHRNYSNSNGLKFKEEEEVMKRLNKVLTERVYDVLRNGRFVEGRAYYNYSIHLYSHECKFVELLVDEVNDEIVWICDAHESDLEKYISTVDLQQLLR